MKKVRWPIILLTVLAVIAVVGCVLFLPPIFRFIRAETAVTAHAQSRAPRPGDEQEWASVTYLSMGGAVGSGWTEVNLLSPRDSLPGQKRNRLWDGDHLHVIGVRWNSPDSLDVLVAENAALRRHREEVTTRRTHGIVVRTVVTPPDAKRRAE